jgi:hexosaminidase
MPTFEQVQYMVFPRILALSEVVWHGPAKSLDREYAGFTRRVGSFFARLDAMGVNYANHLYDIASIHRVEFSSSPVDQNGIKGQSSDAKAHASSAESAAVEATGQTAIKPVINYALINPLPDLNMEYRLNQGPWAAYTGPINITENTGLEARLLRNGKTVGRVMRDSLMLHAGLGSVSSVVPEPHSSYNAGGITALTNGKRGDDNRYGDSEWLGFLGEDISINLDLKQGAEAQSLNMRFYHGPGQWIYAPKSIKLELVYSDGHQKTITLPVDATAKNGPHAQSWALPNAPGTTLKSCALKVTPYGIIPQGEQGAGQTAWTFIDEIIFEK